MHKSKLKRAKINYNNIVNILVFVGENLYQIAPSLLSFCVQHLLRWKQVRSVQADSKRLLFQPQQTRRDETEEFLQKLWQCLML